MPLQKLTAFTKKVADLADKPNATMTAAEVKAQFDAAPDEVRQYLNQLIDALQSTTDGDSGADNIKVTPISTSPDTLQGVLEWLKTQIDNTVLGQIPDGSITDEKLSDGAADIKQKFNEHKAETASLTTKGHVQLSNSTTSTDDTKAATPSAVKVAMDKANAAIPSSEKGVANGVAPLGADSKVPAENLPTLAWEKIGEIILSVDAATVEFANIPQTHKDLKILIHGQSTYTTTDGVFVNLVINDIATGYAYAEINNYSAGATPTGNASASAAFLRIANSFGSSKSSGSRGSAEVTINGYTSSGYKSVSSRYSSVSGADSVQGICAGHVTGFSSGITKLTFSCSAGSFKTGSRFVLYGLK
jgi:hypothetical protein